jgi:stringent starvation protein B
MNSSRPYLIRAIYEWIVDNGCTPHLLVDAQISAVVVPTQYIENGKIVLNVAPRAVHALELSNEVVRFSARFGGTPMNVVIPVGAVLAVYAKENGKGMVFGEGDGSDAPTPPPAPEKPRRPSLTVVK